MSDTVFALYKALSQLLMPLGFSITVFTLAFFLLLRGMKKTGLSLIFLSVTWLWMWSTPAWSDFIRGRLESVFPYQPPSDYPKADAIVVLGGGVSRYSGYVFPSIDLNRASDRELFAAQLYKAGKSAQIILSGGADPVKHGMPEASGMKIFLINLGIPERDIIAGTKSRNTVENLEEVTNLIRKSQGKSILLVTSALHMKRAHWLFARSGLKVIAAPTDYEVIPSAFSLLKFIPDAEALENSSRAAREYVGLWSYKIRFR
jgi:uncharacterized SAM-binding protein YcdF (DUF218 family)